MQNSVNKKIPERKCIGCSEKKAKKDLIRIVRLPDGQGVELDKTGKKSGRGAYICPSASCLKKAKKRLEYSLECKIPEEVFQKLEMEIESDRQ
ncbi:MAG: YlxR family protein [Clostridia bacterium]|nr:YlxR family protein [Clostridia bacterium]